MSHPSRSRSSSTPARSTRFASALDDLRDLFTADIDRWWPREHHIGKSPLKRAVLEQHAGGRWYSVNEDGSECEVGKVLSWEPPARLLLAWQIAADWQYDPAFVTEVEVTFTAQGPNHTRVELEHRDLEPYGDRAAALRNFIDSAGGWTKIVEQFAKSAQEAEPAPEFANAG